MDRTIGAAVGGNDRPAHVPGVASPIIARAAGLRRLSSGQAPRALAEARAAAR
jgi:hypothetical protein